MKQTFSYRLNSLQQLLLLISFRFQQLLTKGFLRIILRLADDGAANEASLVSVTTV